MTGHTIKSYRKPKIKIMQEWSILRNGKCRTFIFLERIILLFVQTSHNILTRDRKSQQFKYNIPNDTLSCFRQHINIIETIRKLNFNVIAGRFEAQVAIC